MDDIIILGSDKKELFTLEKEIEGYLWNELKLLVKENWQIFPIESRSIDFIGYKYTTTGVLVSKTTEKRFKKLSYKIRRQGKLTKRDYSGFNSYLGLLEQGNCKALWEAYY